MMILVDNCLRSTTTTKQKPQIEKYTHLGVVPINTSFLRKYRKRKI
jgi:hypothetical protein